MILTYLPIRLRVGCSTLFEFDTGAGIEDISAANGFETQTFPGDDVIFTEGYDAIIAPLAAGLDIRLNAPVSRIWHDSVEVEIHDISADYAICTVPLDVLKSNAIEFDPPLPVSLRDAIEQISFGSVTKIAMKFDEPFWGIDTPYLGMTTEPKGRWNYWSNYRTFSDGNILLGLSVGQYAPVADRMIKARMMAYALDVLRSVWAAMLVHHETFSRRIGRRINISMAHIHLLKQVGHLRSLVSSKNLSKNGFTLQVNIQVLNTEAPSAARAYQDNEQQVQSWRFNHSGPWRRCSEMIFRPQIYQCLSSLLPPVKTDIRQPQLDPNQRRLPSGNSMLCAWLKSAECSVRQPSG